jgi:hypothetical protein
MSECGALGVPVQRTGVARLGLRHGRYIVDVAGCDETTYVDVELSDEMAEGVQIVAAATVERHRSSCCPVLSITSYESASVYAREAAAETRDDQP